MDRHLLLSGSDGEKENNFSGANGYRENILESSDDDFDRFLLESTTPRRKVASPKRCTAKKECSQATVLSSESDGGFETFLNRMKTPKTVGKKTSAIDSEGGLKTFIVDDFSSDDDFIQRKPSRVPKSTRTPVSVRPATLLSGFDSYPVFVSDSDDESHIAVKSSWRTRHQKLRVPQRTDTVPQPCRGEEGSPLPTPAPLLLPALRTPTSSLPTRPVPASAPPARSRTAPSELNDTTSSEEEFTSLLERLKRKNRVHSNPLVPIHNTDPESRSKPLTSVPAVKVLTAAASKSLDHTPPAAKTTLSKPTVSQTEPRVGSKSRVVLCKSPGCFLQTLSLPGSSYGRNFKQNKEDLTSKLYQLYNTSIFDSKLPTNMSVTWNKKLRKTAGYCVTGQERVGGSRYARIELSVKVCDSADRLRDTLVHEMCHAATWLINGVRDGHGRFWQLYARKSTLAHPELPVVTRCHSYDIKYKFQYQCTRCKNTIGRHSKSLDTQRFVCALCTGSLVLLTPANPRAPTPFASFVKENYGSARQDLAGKSHAEVMRKLSADFATKTKLSKS